MILDDIVKVNLSFAVFRFNQHIPVTLNLELRVIQRRRKDLYTPCDTLRHHYFLPLSLY